MNEQKQDLRICSQCGTENEDDYSYCKSCGAVLPVSQAAFEQNRPVTPPPYVVPTQSTYSDPRQYEGPQGNPPNGQPPFNSAPQGNPQYGQPQYGQPQYGQPQYGAGQYPPPPKVVPVPDSIDGVATADIAAFVGSKQEYFIPKFAQHAGRGSFASWNWPVFLFGFLLKIPFVWFFYRKMYKVGSIILAIWIALTVIISGTMLYSLSPIYDGIVAGFKEAAPYISTDNGYSFSYNYNYDNNNNSIYENNNSQNNSKIDEIMNNNIEKCLPEFLSRIPYLIIGSVFAFLLLALYVLSAVYANSLYRNHTLKKIVELKSQRPDMSSFELTLHGGTSTGIAVAIGIIVPILTAFVGWIWMFSFFSDILSALML
ncbi:MAG: zinc-ribbon domain-containing protein [Oscillospiraceae bacterium]|nr:zinc-ribbon domain-containing protein [Oscillospiraceae bacterium]